MTKHSYVIEYPAVSWVLAANRVGAVIFRKVKGEPLEFLERFENPEGRLREHELVSSAPGRTKSSVGGAPKHALGRRSVWHEESAVRFARLLIRRLDDAREGGRFENLVLIAEPHFLGLLRKSFPRNLERTIRKEILRDIKSLDTEEVEKRVVTLLKSGELNRLH